MHKVPIVSTFTSQFTAPSLRAECTTTQQAEIVFVVDASGSVGKKNFKKVQQFLKDVTESFDISQTKVPDRGPRVPGVPHLKGSGSRELCLGQDLSRRYCSQGSPRDSDRAFCATRHASLFFKNAV